MGRGVSRQPRVTGETARRKSDQSRLLALALLLLAACSNSSPTATVQGDDAAEVPTAAPASIPLPHRLRLRPPRPSADPQRLRPLAVPRPPPPRPPPAGTAPRATRSGGAGTPLPTLAQGRSYKTRKALLLHHPEHWTPGAAAGA